MNDWLVVASVVFSMVLSAGISWGVTKARVNGLAETIRELKATKFITRDEYEARHHDLTQLVTSLTLLVNQTLARDNKT